MRDARKSLDFCGTAALLRDNQMQMVTVVHRIIDGVERESMRSLDDPGKEVVRQSGRITYFLPEAQRATSPIGGSQVDTLGMSADLASFQRFYRYRLGAQEPVIGRMTQELIIEPLDEYRYGRRFWIDAENKLPLKYQVVNGDNVLEQLVYTEMRREGLKPLETSETKASPYTVENLPLESLQWRLEKVPPGYKLASYSRHIAPGKNPVEHLLLSDGLSSMSLYIEEMAEGSVPVKTQARHMGSIHLYVRPMGRYLFTVVGEAPLAAVGLVADGVRRVERP